MPQGSDNAKEGPQSERAEIEHTLEDTRRQLRNTQAFLQLLCDGEDPGRRHITEIEASLEKAVRRLEERLNLESAPDGDVTEKADKD